MTAVRSTARSWTAPSVMAVFTIVGLLAALIGEGGVWWVISWAALAVPCAYGVFFLVRGLRGPSANAGKPPER